jgi:hypothetical protein
MNIGPSLFSELTADTGVSGLIVDRVYPEWTREADKVYPLAVYTVETSPHLTNDGPSGLIYSTITIAAIGQTYADADAVGSAILDALNGNRGTWGTVNVQGCFLHENGIDDKVITDPDSEAILFYSQELTFDVAYAAS